MKTYLDIVDTVLRQGKWKGNRTGIRTLVVPNVHFSHNMDDGYPLLTTKKMAIKSMAVELEGFIKGIINKQWYKERGCHIWDEWANPKGIVQYPGTGLIKLETIEDKDDRLKYQKE